MKKALFDANILLDIMLERPGLQPGSSLALSLAENEKIHGYISILCLPVIFHWVKKRAGASKANEAIDKICTILEVIYISKSALKSALSAGSADFEDALNAFCAAEKGIDIIITRNKRDFKGFPVKAVYPEEMLS